MWIPLYKVLVKLCLFVTRFATTSPTTTSTTPSTTSTLVSWVTLDSLSDLDQWLEDTIAEDATYVLSFAVL
eukprot:m.173525 g.173525  ORF g.173525 m.173525 type:complete len:71 (+) comp16739_c0_seq3:1870-2082(+)